MSGSDRQYGTCAACMLFDVPCLLMFFFALSSRLLIAGAKGRSWHYFHIISQGRITQTQKLPMVKVVFIVSFIMKSEQLNQVAEVIQPATGEAVCTSVAAS